MIAVLATHCGDRETMESSREQEGQLSQDPKSYYRERAEVAEVHRELASLYQALVDDENLLPRPQLSENRIDRQA